MTSKSTGLTLLEARNLNRWAEKNPDQLRYGSQFSGKIGLHLKELIRVFRCPTVKIASLKECQAGAF